MTKARIGIVGTGWWATAIQIPAIQGGADADVVALCDLDASRVALAGDRFGIAARYTDVAAMLAAERLDGVIVATPHVAHAAPAIAALRAGCHVLVEKPMATTAADARAMEAAAKAAGRALMVPTGLNFTGYSRTAHDWVAEGRIGTVQHAVCQMGSPLRDLFAGEPMVETEGQMFRPPASTWADPARAGGYAWGQMSHSLAWLTWVAGLDYDSVFAMDVKSKAGVDYHDAAVARTTNGATVSISGASTVPKHVGMHTDVRIYGTEGMIHFSNLPARLELRRHDRDDASVALNDLQAAYDSPLAVHHFAAFCAGKRSDNPSDGAVNARVTEAIAALYLSAAEGRLVRIQEL